MYMNGAAGLTGHFSRCYLQSGGSQCPVCGEPHATGDEQKAYAGRVNDPAACDIAHQCQACGSRWTSQFVLAGCADIVIEWTADDQKDALRQGWGIFTTDDRGMEIQRHDEAEVFDCDNTARHHVMLSNDRVCRKAVAYLQVSPSPDEGIAFTRVTKTRVPGFDADVLSALARHSGCMVRVEAFGTAEKGFTGWFGRNPKQFSLNLKFEAACNGDKDAIAKLGLFQPGNLGSLMPDGSFLNLTIAA